MVGNAGAGNAGAAPSAPSGAVGSKIDIVESICPTLGSKFC